MAHRTRIRSSRAPDDETIPFYARVGVPWFWVVDPRDRTVEVRRLESERWSIVATFVDTETMRAPPFEEVEIPLARLWAPAPRP